MYFLLSTDFFSKNKSFQKILSTKQIEFTKQFAPDQAYICQASSGSKLFEKVISSRRRQARSAYYTHA